jgi:hypothetical protein
MISPSVSGIFRCKKRKVCLVKKTTMFLIALVAAVSSFAQVKPKGVNWDEQYAFDKCNTFKIEFYAKKGELMKTMPFKTLYQSQGENFSVRVESDRKGGGMETVIDKKNMTAIQMFGTGGGATPLYNAGAFKYPGEKDLKRLDLAATTETKQILGIACKKYTYTFKKIFGEVWLTDQITSSNDIGLFRACKMAALHNTLSVPGFVMEMTTEDAKGGKTLMTTVSLQNDVSDTVNFKGVEMGKAFNTVNYYTF